MDNSSPTLPLTRTWRYASFWQDKNPILLDNELAVEIDTGKAKLGNGRTAYDDLAYLNDSSRPALAPTQQSNSGTLDLNQIFESGFYTVAAGALVSEEDLQLVNGPVDDDLEPIAVIGGLYVTSGKLNAPDSGYNGGAILSQVLVGLSSVDFQTHVWVRSAILEGWSPWDDLSAAPPALPETAPTLADLYEAHTGFYTVDSPTAQNIGDLPVGSNPYGLVDIQLPRDGFQESTVHHQTATNQDGTWTRKLTVPDNDPPFATDWAKTPSADDLLVLNNRIDSLENA